jgi:hypothetical protein
MTALAAERTARRSRQRRVEALLREIDDRRRELYRLNASGVQRAGVRDLKGELLEVRRRLREVVAASDARVLEWSWAQVVPGDVGPARSLGSLERG